MRSRKKPKILCVLRVVVVERGSGIKLQVDAMIATSWSASAKVNGQYTITNNQYPISNIQYPIYNGQSGIFVIVFFSPLTIAHRLARKCLLSKIQERRFLWVLEKTCKARRTGRANYSLTLNTHFHSNVSKLSARIITNWHCLGQTSIICLHFQRSF